LAHRYPVFAQYRLAALLAWSGAAGAQAWPAKPVTWVVPTSPGGGVDAESRLYAQKLSEILGRSFVLEYKPGAGSTLAATYVAKAAPDGYTILSMTPTHTLAPFVYARPPYDLNRDFAPISLTSRRPSLIMVHPSLPVKSLTEYLALARKRPGEILVGTSGTGTIGDLALHWLHNLGGASVIYVPYKGGAPSYVALISGEIQIALGSPAAMAGHVRTGRVRIVAVSTSERIRLFPDVPTVAEQGLPGFDYAQWIAVVAPAKTPAAIVNRLSEELARVVKMPDVAQKLSDDGTLMIGSTPGELRQYMADESARWRKVVADAGIKLAE